MLTKIIFVDLHSDLADAWTAHKRNIPVDIEILQNTDIASIPATSNIAFVSPANCKGFMNGGVDQVYMDMFPGIEEKVKCAIRKNGKLTFLGQYFLPIGEALVVQTDIAPTWLISTPTMFLPFDVSETNNAYHATYAAMKATINNGDITHIVFPGMATGYGKMSATNAAKQMWDAIEDALTGKPAKYSIDQIVNEQPPIYACKEYFETYGAHSKILKIVSS